LLWQKIRIHVTRSKRWRPQPQSLQKFDFGASIALTAAVLIVLQTHIRFERGTDGKYNLLVEKKPTSDALLKGLVQKLISYTISAWRNLRKQEGSWRAIAPALRTSPKGGGVGVSIIVALAVVMWSIFLVRTDYDDHMQLIAERASGLRRISQLERELQAHRHSVSTSDPVFPNLIYMLQAFAVFRGEVHGESCVVRITAPATAQPLASVFAQFSVSTSNCATFGPDAPLNTNPDIKSEALDGMVPDAIVFHAQREDRAANELFMRL
jgi:hypothetical protein